MRLKVLHLVSLVMVLWACAPVPGIAETFPKRPIRIIVPAAA